MPRSHKQGAPLLALINCGLDRVRQLLLLLLGARYVRDPILIPPRAMKVFQQGWKLFVVISLVCHEAISATFSRPDVALKKKDGNQEQIPECDNNKTPETPAMQQQQKQKKKFLNLTKPLHAIYSNIFKSPEAVLVSFCVLRFLVFVFTRSNYIIG